MQDIVAIKAMLDYDQFLKYADIFFSLKNMETEQKRMLKTLRSYYDTYKTDKITVDELETYFNSENPSIQNAAMIKKMFEDLRTVHIENDDLIANIMDQIVEKYYCAEISVIGMAMSEDQAPHGIDQIEHLVRKYRSQAEGMEDIESDVCLTEFKTLLAEDKEGGFDWPVATINANLGRVKPGQLGHIFARPNVGKSSMAINLGVKTVVELVKAREEGVVLFLNNEEDIGRMRLRALSCMTRKTYQQISDEYKVCTNLWDKYGGDRIKFIGNMVHIAEIEKHIRNFKPVLTFIDQGPKVRIYDKDLSEVQRLQTLYNQYRELAKIYNTALITLGQADSAAENREYLTLNNLDSSKVGIPGELDWALGIGINDKHPGRRFFNVAKNKGRMGRGVMVFDDTISRYTDVK